MFTAIFERSVLHVLRNACASSECVTRVVVKPTFWIVAFLLELSWIQTKTVEYSCSVIIDVSSRREHCAVSKNQLTTVWCTVSIQSGCARRRNPKRCEMKSFGVVGSDACTTSTNSSWLDRQCDSNVGLGPGEAAKRAGKLPTLGKYDMLCLPILVIVPVRKVGTVSEIEEARYERSVVHY